MASYKDIIVTSESLETFLSSIRQILVTLSEDEAQQFNEILDFYFTRFQFKDTWERMNNRTIGQIILDYDAMKSRGEENPAIASGEIDSLQYSLHKRKLHKRTEEDEEDKSAS